MLESKIVSAKVEVNECQTDLSNAIRNQAESNQYKHLDESERGELIRRDIQIKLLSHRVAELKRSQFKQLSDGPLLAIKDEEKVGEFIKNCLTLYRNRQKKQKMLRNLEAVHFNIAESSHENTVDLGGSMDGNAEGTNL